MYQRRYSTTSFLKYASNFLTDRLKENTTKEVSKMAVQKYTAKNGKLLWRFSVWYTDWTGEKKRKKQEGFKTQREAKEAEANFVNSKKTDVDITFANLVDAYIENRIARISPTTIATKGHMIRTKILPYFGKMPISAIDTATVMKWQTELINHRQSNGEPYSQTYLRQIHNQLSTIFNFAIKYYGLARNPAQLCGSMGKQNAEKFDFWTYDEFQTFIQATKDDISAHTIYSLFFYSGMRMGELLALTFNDFDFEKCTVSIKKSLAVVNGTPVIKATKTPKSNRVIALPPKVMDMVKDYADHLYDCRADKPLLQASKTSLHREMKKYCNISGIRKIKVHELRHSHASHLIELGISPLTISERLGHEDIKTTLNTYSHLYPNKQSEVATMLSEYVL